MKPPPALAIARAPAPPVTLTYEEEVLADNPSLYWRLGEPSGATAADGSGNGRDGTYVSCTLAQSGLVTGTDKSVQFDGAASEVVQSVYNPMANGDTRTFELWAYRDVDDYQALLWPDGSTETQWKVNGGGTNAVVLTVAGTHATWSGAWPGLSQIVHAVVVFTQGGGANNAELFINGASVGKQTNAGTWPSFSTMYLGQGFAGHWNGRLDEFAVYESGLSAARIAAHYAAAL